MLGTGVHAKDIADQGQDLSRKSHQPGQDKNDQHAARDADMQIRRAYGILAYLCLAAGAVFILVALAREARFLWFAFLFLGLGLLFFLPFTRNETEPRWRDTAERVLGVVGGLGVLGVGAGEAATHWTLAGTALWASVLGFMIWVMAAATWLLANP